MIIYNPHDESIIQERIKHVNNILNKLPFKHCFISGSFLYKEKYKDIDIFIITRAEKKIKNYLKTDNKIRTEDKLRTNNKIKANNKPITENIPDDIKDYNKAKINVIDFNDLYSLFYHSVSKSCISKNILPQRPLKATLSDYWAVINEAVPTLLNQKTTYHKDVRSLVLYTEYFKTGNVLDTFQLNKKIMQFKDYKQIIDYIQNELPLIIQTKSIQAKKKKSYQKSYLKKFFYTQAGFYKDMLSYKAQKFLYNLTHSILKGVAYG